MVSGTYYDERGFVLSGCEYKEQTKPFVEPGFSLLRGRRLLFVGVGEGMFDEHMLPLLRRLEDDFEKNGASEPRA